MVKYAKNLFTYISIAINYCFYFERGNKHEKN